jgi:hypothetical protein
MARPQVLTSMTKLQMTIIYCPHPAENGLIIEDAALGSCGFGDCTVT